MHLTRLALTNFRGFASLTLELDPQLTVLHGWNGTGKSAITQALIIALARWTQHFSEKARLDIGLDDVRRVALADDRLEPTFPTSIEVEANLRDAPVSWLLSRASVDSGSGKETPVDDLALQAVKRVNDSDPLDLPLILAVRPTAGISTGNDRSSPPPSRLKAYDDSFSTHGALGDLERWFKHQEDAVTQRARENLTPEQEQAFTEHIFKHIEAGDESPPGAVALRQVLGLAPANETVAVSRAVAAVLEGAKDLRYDLKTEELRVVWEDGRQLPLRMLSDGQRRVMSLVARIAWMAWRLNPHKGTDAPAHTAGVVIIDEVELHLHPAWQQRIIERLQAVFPKLQFIVTTHSPQVLSTVHARHVRHLTLTDGVGRAVPADQQTRGVEAGDVLAFEMQVDPAPDVPELRDLYAYRAMIEDGKARSEAGQQLRARLDEHYGARNQLMIDCDRLIRLYDFQRRHGQRS